MTSTLPIFRMSVVILFDSGASHYFISSKLCHKKRIDFEIQNLALNISIYSREEVKTDKVVWRVKLDFGGKDLNVDLYSMDVRDFDEILGMN